MLTTCKGQLATEKTKQIQLSEKTRNTTNVYNVDYMGKCSNVLFTDELFMPSQNFKLH